MLADPRAAKSMETFLGQWLGYESLGITVIPDPRSFKAFTPPLMEAMKSETSMMFESLVRDNGSLLQLLEANFKSPGSTSLFREKMKSPGYGNYVDHDKLFSGEITAKGM